jgi:hypothetical protein
LSAIKVSAFSPAPAASAAGISSIDPPAIGTADR